MTPQPPALPETPAVPEAKTLPELSALPETPLPPQTPTLQESPAIPEAPVPPAAKPPVEAAPNLPKTPPAAELPPAEAPPEKLDTIFQAPSPTERSQQPGLQAVPTPPKKAEPDELLEPSVETPAKPVPEDRDVEAEAKEAEDELEEALFLMADSNCESAAPAPPASKDPPVKAEKKPEQKPEPEKPAAEKPKKPTPAMFSAKPAGDSKPRSPFLRDHKSDAATPAPRPAPKKPEPVTVHVTVPKQAKPKEPAKPASPPELQSPPLAPSTSLPSAPAAANPPSQEQPSLPVLPAPEKPPAPAPQASTPVPPAAPTAPLELPGVQAATPIPENKLPADAPAIPSPREAQSPPAPAPAAPQQAVLGGGAHLTPVPLQEKSASQEKAAPIEGTDPAPRPTLTKAELKAKDRAEKLAEKKAAKAAKKAEKSRKSKPAAKPKSKAKVKEKAEKKPPKPKAEPKAKAKPEPKAKAEPKSKPEPKAKRKPRPKPKAKAEPKPKVKKVGGLRRFFLVGLPILLVLGAAGTFAYMNKEKFGFAAGGSDGPKDLEPADVAVVVDKKPGPKVPAMPDQIFRTPGQKPPTDPTQTSVRQETIEEPPPAIQFTDQELKQILKDPKRTLEAFLLAGNVEDLLNFVADRETVEKDIRAYYKNGKRTPINAQEVSFDSSGVIDDTAMAVYLYRVTTSRKKLTVAVEETEGGYRVDWSAFTQFHDGLLEKFVRNPEAGSGNFYVILRRSHYFGNDVPDSDDLHVFRIQSPIPPYLSASVFLKRDNPNAKAILERYRWSTDYRPYVKLKWAKSEDGDPRIELEEIIRHKWRR